MQTNTACAGKCIYESYKFEYQVIHLEFIRNKHLELEIVCYNKHNTLDKESTLKYNTNNFNSADEKLKIALSIMDSVIKNLNLEKEKLYKLVVRNREVFYLSEV